MGGRNELDLKVSPEEPQGPRMESITSKKPLFLDWFEVLR